MEAIESEAKQDYLVDQHLVNELRQLRANSNIFQYNNSFADQKEKLQGACRPDYKVPPDLIDNVPELKLKILQLAKVYGLNADIN